MCRLESGIVNRAQQLLTAPGPTAFDDVPPQATPAAQAARGRAVRVRMPRSAHAEAGTSAGREVALLERQADSLAAVPEQMDAESMRICAELCAATLARSLRDASRTGRIVVQTGQ
jgi:hypothetical protein